MPKNYHLKIGAFYQDGKLCFDYNVSHGLKPADVANELERIAAQIRRNSETIGYTKSLMRENESQKG